LAVAFEGASLSPYPGAHVGRAPPGLLHRMGRSRRSGGGQPVFRRRAHRLVLRWQASWRKRLQLGYPRCGGTARRDL